MAHPEQIHIIRVSLMPLMVKILSERANFAASVRATRLLRLVINHLLFALAPECEIALSLVNHMLDPDAAVMWKRALCLELFRGIHAEPALIRSVYSHYDEQEGTRNIIREHLATLVRLASENPSAIGLGHQSTIAASTSKTVDDSGEQSTVHNSGILGSVGAASTMIEPNAPGISTHWSTVRTACIDQLDKSEAPSLPTTYIYGLTLTCINNFSDGLARFLLPFTVPSEAKSKRKHPMSQGKEESTSAVLSIGETPSATGKEKKLLRNRSFRSRRMPVNPLSLEDNVLYSQISTSGRMVDNCWPALLAACSTFLNASLDSDYYHALIRSFQKFTQVAGLLEMTTPRDAFLTTLGKHAVPSASLTTPMSETHFPASVLNEHDSSQNGEDTESDRESSSARSISSDHPRQSIDRRIFRLNTRNLLCLRALLNLGIALGQVLGKSWSIILEILQQADLILSRSKGARRQTGGRHSRQPSEDQTVGGISIVPGGFGLEITAAETAASRMIESTVDLSDKAFVDVLNCLCSLLRNVDTISEKPISRLRSAQSVVQTHHRVVTANGVSTDGTTNDRANDFVLEKLGDLIQCNLTRLLQAETDETGWDLLVAAFVTLLSSPKMSPDIRIQAAQTLNSLVLSVAVAKELASFEQQDDVRRRGLDALLREIHSFHDQGRQDTRVSQSCEIEIHRLALEALRTILEQCGDSLHHGWDSVFALLTSVFNKRQSFSSAELQGNPELNVMSPKLVRSSFGSLQLICSDFLNSVPQSCLPILLETLYSFCAQDQDLNISLTVSNPMGSTRKRICAYLPFIRQQLLFGTSQISFGATTRVSHSTAASWNVNPGSISWILCTHKITMYHSQLYGSACSFI